MAYPLEASTGADAQNGASAAAQHRWVLKYGDKVYGPYSFDAMKAYVAEGRVAEHSLLAPEGTPAGATMWQYAADIPLFAELFAGLANETLETPAEPNKSEPATVDLHDTASEQDMDGEAGDAGAADVPARQPAARQPDIAPESSAAQPAAEGQRPAYGPGKGQIDRRRQPDTANFLIVMDIKARFTGPLEQAIMSLGPAYKLAPNVWCVNTDATAAGLLNDLSQHIGRTDSMFIADTTRDRTAWSSMGPEVDAKIRRVWRRTY
ncbi:MAG: DUF4339 domain-containing protein [Parvibaculaceae bacterium]|nr:DUF4339 domain-containing protein [Parvibaculaceae bacterium]